MQVSTAALRAVAPRRGRVVRGSVRVHAAVRSTPLRLRPRCAASPAQHSNCEAAGPGRLLVWPRARPGGGRTGAMLLPLRPATGRPHGGPLALLRRAAHRATARLPQACPIVAPRTGAAGRLCLCFRPRRPLLPAPSDTALSAAAAAWNQLYCVCLAACARGAPDGLVRRGHRPFRAGGPGSEADAGEADNGAEAGVLQRHAHCAVRGLAAGCH